MTNAKGNLAVYFRYPGNDRDISGDGASSGLNPAPNLGNVVKIQHPAVRELIPNTGSGDPWVWNTQNRVELFMNNLRGQRTITIGADGSIDLDIRYPENDPEGAGQFVTSTLSNSQYGFIKEKHVDVDPALVMTLLGPDADLPAFTAGVSPIVPRTGTGPYLDLVTSFQPSNRGTGCTGCAYDPTGAPLQMTDPRLKTTRFERNELGEPYLVVGPAPYYYATEMWFDANRNTTRVDKKDLLVQFDSDNPADPRYGRFTPSGSATDADLPVRPGPGGSVRPGWFTDLAVFDLLNQKIETDIDATGSSPSSLVTQTAFDFNQNPIRITSPLQKTIEMDYDERDLNIATRVGGPGGSVTVNVFDGNKNLTDIIGPAVRGTPDQTLTAVIADAFRSGESQTFSGDWLVHNEFDGFDRKLTARDPAGGTLATTFDPGGRPIASQMFGSPGGPTPTDLTGSGNVPLASDETRFDEAGRPYEMQKDVFLNTGLSGSTIIHTLPSGRAVTHTGGGLAANSTANNHTATATLTSGQTSYVLARLVFDPVGRTIAKADDNGAITRVTLDGAGRRINTTDALGNQLQRTLDANGNAVLTTSVEVCTIGGVTTIESFTSGNAFDCMNRPIIGMRQGPDGSFSTFWLLALDYPSAQQTLFTFTGFDSRNNPTNRVDPKLNTSIADFDGASRKLRDKRHLRPSGDGSTSIYKTVLTQTGFDADSNLQRLIDDNGGVTQWAYDNQDRDTVMAFHDGSTRTKVYNPASDVVGFTDENGSIFTNSFDVLGRKVTVGITPAAGVAGNSGTGVAGTTAQGFQFDGLSRPTFGRDTLSSTANTDCGFIYDSLGRVVEEPQTLAGSTKYITNNAFKSYPAIQFTFPNNRQINQGFDLLYRKNTINEASDSSSIAAWQFFGGRIATVALGNGIVTSFMNDAGTNSAVQSAVPNPPWGSISTDHLGYDGTGRPIGKRHKLPGGSTLVGFTTQYDPSSNKLYERALHAESRSSAYAMDSMDRLLAYLRGVIVPAVSDGWAGMTVDDWAGLTVGGWASLAVGGSTPAFVPETPIALPNTFSQRSYALDGLGNWRNTGFTPAGGSPALELRTHNKLNQITAFGVSPTSTPVTYDNGNNVAPTATRGNGNIANDGTRANIWDALNRLIVVKRTSDGLTIGAYTYDATARRVESIITNGGVTGDVPNATKRFLLAAQQIVEELDGSGSPTLQYVWGQYIDELVQLFALTAAGPQPVTGKCYLLSDLLYRGAALTNSAAAIVETYDMDAYGETLLFSAAGTGGSWFADDIVRATSSACRYVFTGREYDAETGNYYYRTRYYNPSFGRFIGRDSNLSRSLDVYSYVTNRPVSYLDAFGLLPHQGGMWVGPGLMAADPGSSDLSPVVPSGGPGKGPAVPLPPGDRWSATGQIGEITKDSYANQLTQTKQKTVNIPGILKAADGCCYQYSVVIGDWTDVRRHYIEYDLYDTFEHETPSTILQSSAKVMGLASAILAFTPLKMVSNITGAAGIGAGLFGWSTVSGGRTLVATNLRFYDRPATTLHLTTTGEISVTKVACPSDQRQFDQDSTAYNSFMSQFQSDNALLDRARTEGP